MWRRQWLRFIEGLWWRHVGGPQCQRVRKGPVLIGGDVLSATWVLFNTVGDDFCQTNIPWAFSNLWFIYFQNNYKTLWNSKWYTVGPFKFSIYLFIYPKIITILHEIRNVLIDVFLSIFLITYLRKKTRKNFIVKILINEII